MCRWKNKSRAAALRRVDGRIYRLGRSQPALYPALAEGIHDARKCSTRLQPRCSCGWGRPGQVLVDRAINSDSIYVAGKRRVTVLPCPGSSAVENGGGGEQGQPSRPSRRPEILCRRLSLPIFYLFDGLAPDPSPRQIVPPEVILDELFDKARAVARIHSGVNGKSLERFGGKVERALLGLVALADFRPCRLGTHARLARSGVACDRRCKGHGDVSGDHGPGNLLEGLGATAIVPGPCPFGVSTSTSLHRRRQVTNARRRRRRRRQTRPPRPPAGGSLAACVTPPVGDGRSQWCGAADRTGSIPGAP